MSSPITVRVPSSSARRVRIPLMLAFATSVVLTSSGAPTAESQLSAPAVCEASTITVTAEADAWVNESSPGSNFASDSILFVNPGPAPLPDTPPSGRRRALVSFPMPGGIPAGCVVAAARLRLFSPEEDAGTRADVLRAAAGWSETQVTWDTQPETTGLAAQTWSRQGYMQWNVTSQVTEMLLGGSHGFVVRDSSETAGGGGGDHSFLSREKGPDPPTLVIQFAAPVTGEPGPAEEPTPAAVSCGEVLTRSTLVTNDLFECPGDGLVIGADAITVDLAGHTVDGVGLGSGIRNDGYSLVTVKNGTVQQFDYGVELLSGTTHNVIQGLTLQLNQLVGIELFDAGEGNEIRDNIIDNNGKGITLLNGTTAAIVDNNTVTFSIGHGALLRDATANQLTRNTFGSGGDLGIGLERATGNRLIGNAVSGNSDGGIELRYESHGNVINSNLVTGSGDMGILVSDSDGNTLTSNTAWYMSDSGISLDYVNDSIVRGNDVRFNPGGLELDQSSRNLIEGNDVSESLGIGIELQNGSSNNLIAFNTANDSAAHGIWLSDGLSPQTGNVLKGNTANRNKNGIVAAGSGHTLTGNVAYDNAGWGINADALSIDGGGNAAGGNGEPAQCTGVRCAPTPPGASACGFPVILWASADASIDQNSPFANKGNDSILRVMSKGPANNHRTLIAFTLPPNPAQCEIESATLRLYASASRPNRTLHALLAGSGWAEHEVTWSNQPDAQGMLVAASSGSGYIEWDVTSLVREMRIAPDADVNHGFMIRDAQEGSDAEQQFHSREDLQLPPELFITFSTTAPETVIDSAPASATTDTSAVFTFSSNEAETTFECALDSAAFAACTSPASYLNLSVGAHAFAVRATDAAGNVEATPASYAWSIEAPPVVVDCGPSITLPASADAWIDQNSASTNKGTDSILKVLSKGPADNARALVAFTLPAAIPSGCTIESATLRLYAASSATGRTIHVLPLASTWTEAAVTWVNQPATAGSPAEAVSRLGYLDWDVTLLVRALRESGSAVGFILRDAQEGADAEQQFHGREKGDAPPQLVIAFSPIR